MAYQLPRIGEQRFAQADQRLFNGSPLDQFANMQKNFSAQQGQDPQQDMANRQALKDAGLSYQLSEEAKKAAMQQQWGSMFGLGGEQQQQPLQQPLVNNPGRSNYKNNVGTYLHL